MTKYLETKTNSIEEAIKSVVLGEAMSGKDVAKRMMKIQTMKSFASKVAKMKTVSRDDLEKMLPDYIDGGDITKVIKEKLDPVNKVAVKKKFDNRKDKDIDNDGDVDSTDKYLHKRRKAISKAVSKEEVEIDEGYESEVMKVLNKADIDGYFKMGKLHVNKRDAKDAKKALEDSDEITKLPKMVMEDNKMMKLTKRQRQALSSPAAKGKGKSSVTLPGAEFLSKKKQPMKVGRQSQVVKYEAYDIGNDYAKHTLRVTPGQGEKDVDEMLGIAQKKNVSMREALAKVWGMDEGASPFEENNAALQKKLDKLYGKKKGNNAALQKKLDKLYGKKKGAKKDLTKETKDGKTMTGEKPTSVQVNPKIEDK